MTIASNLNINDILKDSSAEERVLVYFNEMGNMIALNKALMTESEMDVLSESFKLRHEVDIFNKYLFFFTRFQLFILGAEHSLARIEQRKSVLWGIFLSETKRYRIQDDVAFIIYKILHEKGFITKQQKPKLKKMLSEVEWVIEESSIERSLRKMFVKDGGDGSGDGYEQNGIVAYVKNSKIWIKTELEIASHNLKLLKEAYDSCDKKFTAIEEKIEMITNDIATTESYVEGIFDKLSEDAKADVGYSGERAGDDEKE